MIFKPVVVLMIFWVLLISPVSCLAAEAFTLRIFTEEYPPYNFLDGNEVKGSSTEILLKILERMDIGIDEKDIQLVPWARAYNEALNIKNTMVYSTVRTKEREDKFIWVGPIAISEIGLIARKSDNITVKSIDELTANHRIGVVREDVAHQLMRKLRPDLNLDISHSIESNLFKLKKKRIGLFIHDVNMLPFFLKHEQLDLDEFKPVFSITTLGVYFAFNLNTDLELINRFQKAFNEVRVTPLFFPHTRSPESPQKFTSPQ